MSSMVTITSKGQVTLPVDVRRALSLKAGDKLILTVEEDRLVIRPVIDFLSLAGTVPVPPEVRGMTWQQIKDAAYRDRAVE